MSILQYLKEMINFLPELFPQDLSAITLSDCTHFIGVWSAKRPLGEALRKVIYPGKKISDKVMLGQVVKHKKKITKYYTKEESIFNYPYLAVGVPVFENGELTGGICTVREETILETQSRCRMLLEVQNIMGESMNNLTEKMDSLVDKYKETRKINDLMQDVIQKASFLQVNTLLKATNMQDEYKESFLALADEIKKMAHDTKDASFKIIKLLNEFDVNAADFFSSIKHIEIIVASMSNSINSIMDYLSKQSDMIIHDDNNKKLYFGKED